MWVAGVLGLLIIGTSLTVVVGWTARQLPEDQTWVTAGLGGMFKDIAGTLAGFTIAAATFLGSLSQDKSSQSLAAAVGLLLLSFLILMSTAMLYNSIPTTQAADTATTASFQAQLAIQANAAYFIGVALGWLALRPLLQLIGLPDLANAFTWLLFITALAGSARLAGLTYRLSTASPAACVCIPAVGFILPAFFWFVLARAWPSLLPGTDVALQLGFVAFAVSVFALVMQASLLLVHGHTPWNARILAAGHRIAIGVSQAAVMVIALTWLAVASN